MTHEQRLAQLRALPVQHRYFDIEARRIAPEDAPAGLRARSTDDQPIFEVAISSERPVPRWYGTEVLIHQKSAIDMSYLKRGAAVLVDHGGDQVGVMESAWLDGDNVLRGYMRFSRNARGQEVRRDVEDGIRRFISVGYQWNEARVAEQGEAEGETWHVTRWTPMEVSIVSVPADVSVGFGRSNDDAVLHPFKITQPSRGTSTMSNENTSDAVLSRRERRERARREDEAADISFMCTREGHPELAATFIRAGASANDVGRHLLSMRGGPGPSDLLPPMPEQAFRAVPRREDGPGDYSLCRALVALADGGNSPELEYSKDLAHRFKYAQRSNSVLVPLHVFTQKRAVLDSATATTARELVFTESGELIDLLRTLPVVAQLGATFLPGLVGPVGFPRETAAATAYWVAENPGADVTESNLTTDVVTLAPKTLMGTTSYTRQLLAQSSTNVEQLVRRDFAAIHARALDRAALHGAGNATEPAGIYAIAGVNSHAVGGAPNFADIIDMQTMVAVDNALGGRMGWASTPGIAGKLMQTLVASAAGSAMIWTGTFEDGRLGGYKAISSNQVSSTLGAGSEHGLIFGDWSSLMIGLWGALEIIVDPYAQKKRGIIEVTSFQMADIDVRHPESFVKGTGATL